METNLDSRRIEYLPSPEDIVRECAVIRDGWTRNERRRRFLGSQLPDDLPAAWHPPVIDTSSFSLAASRGHGDLAS